MSVQPTEQTLIANIVAGRAMPPDGGPTLPVADPATGREIGQVPLSNPLQVDAAVKAAQEMQREWAALPTVRRARVMFRAQNLLAARLEEFARLVSEENGKSLADARGEMMRGLEVLEFAAGMPAHMQGVTSTEVGRGVDAETRLYPVGVVAGITPFNFPGMIPLWMVPIALAAGNAFVLKPSEQTPITATRLAELFVEAGSPDGVLNVVHGGPDAVNALIVHPGVSAVSFVGSARVARHVYVTATAAGKRVQALAGAKNFLIALDDAPLDDTAESVFSSAFGNAGQRCLAGSILLATPGIFPRLCDALVERVRRTRIGPGLDESSVITPVCSSAAQDRIMKAIQTAADSGARVLVGGERVQEPGHFLVPALIADVRPDMEIMREEIFGPVLAVMRVENLDEAIELANTSEYGNSSSIYTSSGAAARIFRDRIEAGMLGINIGVPAPIGYLPFSGWKGSFYGDLHANGLDAVRFYTRPKSITSRWLPQP